MSYSHLYIAIDEYNHPELRRKKKIKEGTIQMKQKNITVCLSYGTDQDIENKSRKLDDTEFEGIPKRTRYTSRAQTGQSIKLRRAIEIYWNIEELLKDVDDFGIERSTEYKIYKIVEKYLKERE